MSRLALLCWECGGGRGHIASLTSIARRLRERGWVCVLAVPPDANYPDPRKEGWQVYSVPRWGDGAEAPMRKTDSSASMVDVLADIGLRSAERVRRKIDQWRGLFAECSPDIVVADFAPGAVLAARGRVPCLAVGPGYAVPPPGMPRFPLLHDFTAAVYDESALRDLVNSVLRKVATKPLDRLVETLTGDAQAVCTLPLLDPYGAQRTEAVLGPVTGAPIVPRETGAAEVFCYLREATGVDRIATFARALVGIPASVVAYMPDLAPGPRRELRAQGVDVLDAPAPMTSQLARSRLVVHFGGHGIAAAALLAGVPQVVLNFDVEKWLIARALADRGVARRFDYRSASGEEVHQGICAALADGRMLIAAEQAAAENELYRRRDVVGEIAATCERLAA